jgi:hypothetical protein
MNPNPLSVLRLIVPLVDAIRDPFFNPSVSPAEALSTRIAMIDEARPIRLMWTLIEQQPPWSGAGTWAAVAHSRLTCRRQPRMLVSGATRPHLARQGSLPVLRRAGLDEPAVHAHRQRASPHKTDRYGPHARAEEARSRHKSTIQVSAVCPPIDRGRGNGNVRFAPNTRRRYGRPILEIA